MCVTAAKMLFVMHISFRTGSPAVGGDQQSEGTHYSTCTEIGLSTNLIKAFLSFAIVW